jgi:hypothetical protein
MALSSQKSKVAQSNTLSDNDVNAAFRITFMVLPSGMIEYSNIFSTDMGEITAH